MNNVKSGDGDRTDSVKSTWVSVHSGSGPLEDFKNSLLYLAIGHMAERMQSDRKNCACRSLFVLFIDRRYLVWFSHFKN